MFQWGQKSGIEIFPLIERKRNEDKTHLPLVSEPSLMLLDSWFCPTDSITTDLSYLIQCSANIRRSCQANPRYAVQYDSIEASHRTGHIIMCPFFLSFTGLWTSDSYELKYDLNNIKYWIRRQIKSSHITSINIEIEQICN